MDLDKLWINLGSGLTLDEVWIKNVTRINIG